MYAQPTILIQIPEANIKIINVNLIFSITEFSDVTANSNNI